MSNPVVNARDVSGQFKEQTPAWFYFFTESVADGNQHAAGRARLRHVRVQDAAAAAADADDSP